MFEAKPKDPTVVKSGSALHYMIGEFKLKTGDLATAQAAPRTEQGDPREPGRGPTPRTRSSGETWRSRFYRLGSLADREKNEKAAAEAFEAARKIQQKLVDDGRAQRQTPDRTDADARTRRSGRQGRRDRRPPQCRPQGRQRTAPRYRPLLRPVCPGTPPPTRPRGSKRSRSRRSRPSAGRRLQAASAIASTSRPNPTSTRSEIGTISSRLSVTSDPVDPASRPSETWAPSARLGAGTEDRPGRGRTHNRQRW